MQDEKTEVEEHRQNHTFRNVVHYELRDVATGIAIVRHKGNEQKPWNLSIHKELKAGSQQHNCWNDM
jgi:hypothetical protein